MLPIQSRYVAWRSAALLVISLAVLVPSPARATPFVRDIADGSGNNANYVSLAIDAQGRPHISSYDLTNGDLRYATRGRDGRWTAEVVDAAGTVGTYTSIAVDAEGNPHISYRDVGNGNLKYARRLGGLWLTETVDPSANSVGQYSSLALDPDGHVHIAHYDGTALDLLYATNETGAWVLSTVTSAGDVGAFASLEIDERGHSHIAYRDFTGTDVRYASRAPGQTWTFETIDAAGGQYTSLALDAQGRPRVGYRNSTSGVSYAVRNDGAWTVEEASAANSVDMALAIDPFTGNPRIAYRDFTASDMRFASKSGSTWTIETVDYVTDVGTYAAIALDPFGNPAIAYRDNTTWELIYAESGLQLLSPLEGERWAVGSLQTIRWRGIGVVNVLLSEDGGQTYASLVSAVMENELTITVPDITTDQARIRVSRGAPVSVSDGPGLFSIAPDLVSPWWTEIVDAAGNTGVYCSLALDADGSPRIAYYHSDTGDLRYAARNGGAWATETVHGTGNVGLRPSLALDGQGRPHISYYDNDADDLKYATKDAGTWTIETIEATDDVGQFSSLALDALGRPRVAYWAVTGGDLKYAERNGGVWITEIADAPGGADVGPHNSLALDALGQPRISYIHNVDGNLLYIEKNGGTWSTPVVVDASPNYVGQYSSLALGPGGEPRIAYHDVTAGDLRYASRSGGLWTLDLVDAPGSVGAYCSLAVDERGNPHISYQDGGLSQIKYATKRAGFWRIEIVSAPGDGQYTSLKLDDQGNPHVARWAAAAADLQYLSAAVELSDPAPDVTWPVGASRTVTWDGTGRVDVSLSVDGGNTWMSQGSGVTGGEYRLLVPHTPSRFARYRIERAVPRSVATSGLFTIETSIALLSFAASPASEGGASLAWSTEPGPEDLAGYRLERTAEGAPGGWRTIVPLTRATTHTDREGAPGDRYRLFGINGIGDALLLGEAGLLPAAALAAWPLPYRDGALQISFAVASAPGGGPGQAEVVILDLSGRRVRSIASGTFKAGYHLTSWDGRDDHGRRAPGGLYFISALTGGERNVLKAVVTR